MINVRALYRYLKVAFFRRVLGYKGMDKTAYVVDVEHVSRDIRLSPYAFINYGCHIGPGVSIGKYSMLAPRVAVVGDDHVYDLAGTPVIFSGRPELRRTTVDDDVWIGYGAVVLTGVKIGRGAIVAANSVVTKDVPPYSIVAGAPARLLRDRFEPRERSVHDQMLDEPLVFGQLCEKKSFK